MTERHSDRPEWDSTGERTEVCKTRVFRVMAEPFRCPRTGSENEFITLDCPDWVNIIAVTPEKKIVMIRQFRHGSRRVEWEVPGGCIDPSDADPVAAGIRELKEETGYVGKNARIIGSVSPNPALQNNTCYTVLIEDAVLSGEPNMEDTEDIAAILMKPSEVVSLIQSGKMRYALVMNAILFYLLENNFINTET